MGANGSGRHTDRSTAWDLADLVDLLLNRLDRAFYQPDLLADREWLNEQRQALHSLRDRLKERTMRERAGT